MFKYAILALAALVGQTEAASTEQKAQLRAQIDAAIDE